MSDRSAVQAKAQDVVEQQSDNMAHAIAGAGGGLLSMALTFVAPVVSRERTTNHC
jgi:solute carrier family 25 (peroxisomal adenine nucleotide transporter), member 17